MAYTDPTGYVRQASPTVDYIRGTDEGYSRGGGGGGYQLGYQGDINNITGNGTFSYNYMGPYSLYANNPAMYYNVYGGANNWILRVTCSPSPYNGLKTETGQPYEAYNLSSTLRNTSSHATDKYTGSTYEQEFGSSGFDYYTSALIAGGGNMANYAPLKAPYSLPFNIGLSTFTPRIGVVAEKVDKVDQFADIGGDLITSGATTYFETHIATINKYYSYSKYKTPGDISAFGMRYLTGNGVLKISTGLKFLGVGFSLLGAGTSLLQAHQYYQSNGKYGQQIGYTVGDLGSSGIGFYIGGLYGFAIGAGWTFLVKPILQMNPQDRRQFFNFNYVNANQNLFFK